MKKECIFCDLFCPKKIFLTFLFYLNVLYIVYCVLNKLSEYIYFYRSKDITPYTFAACFLKSSKAFSVSLRLVIKVYSCLKQK